jgi:hypothetical protein
MVVRERRLSRRLAIACWSLIIGLAAVLAAFAGTSAQVAFPTGQNIAPVYEGWEQNPDGSFNLVFGYFNRNWEEEIDVPIGPDNVIQPDGHGQAQPTHFFPRRNRFIFRIRVPKDFGNKEVVWTITSHGTTERAYATLKPDYLLDDIVIQNNIGGGGGGAGGRNTVGNKAPVLKVENEKTRHVKVGQPVILTALVSDDGKPTPEPMPPPTLGVARSGRPTPNSATGLRLSWFVYRGAGPVSFDPPQIRVWEDTREGRNSPWSAGWETPPAPPDGKWVTRATFSNPGTYVLRCLAHDGGLMASEDVTFVVNQ